MRNKIGHISSETTSRVVLAFTAFLMAAPVAMAQVKHCVTSPTEFQLALDAAATNGQDGSNPGHF